MTLREIARTKGPPALAIEAGAARSPAETVHPEIIEQPQAHGFER